MLRHQNKNSKPSITSNMKVFEWLRNDKEDNDMLAYTKVSDVVEQNKR